MLSFPFGDTFPGGASGKEYLANAGDVEVWVRPLDQ